MELLNNLVKENLKDVFKFTVADGLITVQQNGITAFTDTYYNVLKEIEKYIEYKKESALLNAIDCLKHGYGKSRWNNCNLTDVKASEIWNKAIKKLEVL